MPSPIGHALAGVAIAWIAPKHHAEIVSRTSGAPGTSSLALICASLAVLPDIDLLFLPTHRTATHSLFTALAVFIVAAAVTGQVKGRVSWSFAGMCAAAYASHAVCDWMGKDASVPYGLQILWPASDRWFISPWPIFPGTERRQIFSGRSVLINLRAVVAEILIFGPLVTMLWIRRTRRSRVPTSGQGIRRQPFV